MYTWWGSKKKAKEVNLAENSSKNESKDIGKRHVGLFSGMMSGETLAKHVEFLAIKLGHIPKKMNITNHLKMKDGVAGMLNKQLHNT